MIESYKVAEVSEFRRNVARCAGQPLDEICNLRDEPDEPEKKTVLMRIACELLLRAGNLDLCKAILAGTVLAIPDDTWLDPIRRAVEFVEAEDAGEFIVA
jgi:hypothetical protein